MPAIISARLVVPTSRSLLEVSVRAVTVVNSLNWIRSSSNHRRPSSTDGGMEYAEFMHLPRKRFTDFGPCNSEGPKRSLLDHFFTELGAREMKQLSKLLDEDPAVMEHRTNLAKRLELYQSAQSEIDAVAWSK